MYVMSRDANRMGQGFHSTSVLLNNLLWCLWPEQLCVVLQKLKDNKVHNNSQWLAGKLLLLPKMFSCNSYGSKPQLCTDFYMAATVSIGLNASHTRFIYANAIWI